MQEKIENIVRNFFSAIMLAAMYPSGHPKLKSELQRFYELLKEILEQRDSLVIGIIGDEVVVGNVVFFQLSHTFKSLIMELKSKEIEKIGFYKNISLAELVNFLKILSDKELNITSYKDYLKLMGIENITVDKVGVPYDKEKSSLKKTQEVSLENIFNFFSNLLEGKEFDIVRIKLTINDFLERLISSREIFLRASAVRRYDVSTFIHSVNVSLLSMFFVSRLGYSKEDILEVGLAALLHDMGKIAISKKIIKKPGVLTEEEFRKIETHTQLGAKILLRYVNSIGLLPVIVAFEHHLNWDMKGGYPKLLYPIRPNIVSLIISICDFYDALRCRRVYKKGYLPEIVHSIMVHQKGKKFEPSLLEKFFDEVGIFPVGTMVKLTNGSIGIVREQNKEDRFRPKIEILKPFEHMGKLVDLKEEEHITIEKSLDYEDI